MADLEDRVESLEGRMDRAESTIEMLRSDVSDIKTMLRMVATKDDINVLLRDAINAVPGRYATVWSGIGALLVGASLIVSILRWQH